MRYSLVLNGKKASELADYIGVSKSLVSKWLSCSSKISTKQENVIRQFLGSVTDAEVIDRRRIEEIVSTMTKEEKINTIQFILGTL